MALLSTAKCDREHCQERLEVRPSHGNVQLDQALLEHHWVSLWHRQGRKARADAYVFCSWGCVVLWASDQSDREKSVRMASVKAAELEAQHVLEAHGGGGVDCACLDRPHDD